MRIAVSANAPGLQGEASRTFGRCPRYVFLDTETMECETLDNPAAAASGGAGIQAAEFVIRQGAKAVVTGSVGPNASQVLEAAGVPVYLLQPGTVEEAARAFRDGVLPLAPGSAVREGGPRRGAGGGRGDQGGGGGQGGRGGGGGRRRARPGQEE